MKNKVRCSKQVMTEFMEYFEEEVRNIPSVVGNSEEILRTLKTILQVDDHVNFLSRMWLYKSTIPEEYHEMILRPFALCKGIHPFIHAKKFIIDTDIYKFSKEPISFEDIQKINAAGTETC